MDEFRSAHSSHTGDGDTPRPGGGATQDALTAAAELLAGVEASDSARLLLAEVTAAVVTAFTTTSSVRDPLPDTAPDSPAEGLAVVAGIDHLSASLAALDARWQVATQQRIHHADREAGVAARSRGKGTAQEIALARRVSPAASSFSLAAARRMVQTMPELLDALQTGAVTTLQAQTVARSLDAASPETCGEVDRMIGEHPEALHGKSRGRLRSDIQQLIQHLEPGTSRARAERAARARHVTMTPLADGMARVSAVLRAIEATAMMKTLHTRAEVARAAGAKDPVPALEADALVDAVLTGTDDQHSAGPGLDVGIVITDTALLDRDDGQCAKLEGYGALPAHIVSDTLLGRPPGHLPRRGEAHPDREVSAVFRRLYTCPSSGQLVAMESRARAFTTGLARMIRWRDETCRTPWCNARIRHTDHATPVHAGGVTSYANGQGLCARCNYLKEHGLWTLTPLNGDPASETTTTSDETPPPSTSTPTGWRWTSPHGARGTSTTPPLFTNRLRHRRATRHHHDTPGNDPP
ncbi:HNH endonuclease [Brachybacterium sp. YJGR34]|uniref:HNH endonuclease n=1 Tax=Brachybacterium sp. YJGR34 TaxID=2059911 RepID=UPI000E0C0DE5|nr:HNH endonuclease signature motif containing protein [Brachybacterium sp. YJGR34]